MKTYITLLTASLFAANSYGADAGTSLMKQAVADFKNRCTGILQSDASPKTKKDALMGKLDDVRDIYGNDAAIMRELFVIATRPAAEPAAAVPFPQLY